MSAGRASVLAVGFESGRMIGRSWAAAIARIVTSLKAPGVAVVPSRTIGRKAVTTSWRSQEPSGSRPSDATKSRVRAKSRLSSSISGRPSTSRPCESSIAIELRASVSEAPSSTIAIRSSRAIPVPAAPAPASTMRVPVSDPPVDRRAAMITATAIAAVPWISSLKLQIQFR
jgi:hypothetical protein